MVLKGSPVPRLFLPPVFDHLQNPRSSIESYVIFSQLHIAWLWCFLQYNMCQLTTLWTNLGRWSLSPRTVWKTSTTPSVFSRSNRMLMVMNVPVLPQPPLHIQTHNGSTCIKHTRQYMYSMHKAMHVLFNTQGSPCIKNTQLRQYMYRTHKAVHLYKLLSQ